MAYLLDTSICVFFLRGQLDFDKIIRKRGLESFYISELTVFELRYGAENSEDPKKSHKAVDSLLEAYLLFRFTDVLINIQKLRFF